MCARLLCRHFLLFARGTRTPCLPRDMLLPSFCLGVCADTSDRLSTRLSPWHDLRKLVLLLVFPDPLSSLHAGFCCLDVRCCLYGRRRPCTSTHGTGRRIIGMRAGKQCRSVHALGMMMREKKKASQLAAGETLKQLNCQRCVCVCVCAGGSSESRQADPGFSLLATCASFSLSSSPMTTSVDVDSCLSV